MYTTFTAIDPRGLIAQSFSNGSSRNLAVNGSVTPVIFQVKPPPGDCWVIRSIHVVGANLGTLTNGLTFQFGRGSDLWALHDRNPALPSNSLYPILTDADLELLSGEDIGTDLTFKWDLVKAGIMLRVKGPRNGMPSDPGEYLQIVVRDNLSGLTTLTAMVFGHQEVA